MSILSRGTGRGREIADALRGAVALAAILAIFVGILAVPVYFLAVFIAGLGWASWLNALCCTGLAVAELCLLVAVPEYLDRRDDRRELAEMQRAAGGPARYQPPADDRDFAAAAERLSV